MIHAAFYEKPGDWRDSVIRWRTASDTSHCELLLSDGFCYSSSPRDGGVRKAEIDVSEGWTLVELPWIDEQHVLDFYNETQGMGYDLRGVLIGQGLGVKAHGTDDYFCSEWCASGCGLSDSWRYSPGALKALLTDMNRLWRGVCFMKDSELATDIIDLHEKLKQAGYD